MLRVADTLAAVQDGEDQKTLDGALGELNSVLGRTGAQRWLRHCLAEQRGLLSNVIHNCVVEEMRARFQAIDLLYFPNSVIYLANATVQPQWDQDEVAAVAQRVQRRLARLQGEKLEQFIQRKPAGISVAKAAMESGVRIAAIIGQIAARAQGASYSAEKRAEIEDKLREDLKAGLPTLPPEAQALARQLGSCALPANERLQIGELLKGYRKLLEDHGEKLLRERRQRVSERIYALLGWKEAERQVGEAVNAYRWAYLVPFLCSWDMETAIERICADAEAVFGDGVAQDTMRVDSGDQEALVHYLETTLEVTSERVVAAEQFRQHLRRYAEATKTHQQCSVCSAAGATQEWMAADAPPNVKVQLFSNRLPGGHKAEPKRNVCAICRAQFILERLAWPASRRSEQTTFYFHLYPYRSFTAPLLNLWYESVRRVASTETLGFFVDGRQYFTQWTEAEEVPLRKGGKAVGVMAPKLSEWVKNVPLLPLYGGDGSYSEQYLQALETAVVFAEFFGCRVEVSRIATPVLDLTYQPEIALFLDGMPPTLEWLVGSDEKHMLPSNALTRKQVGQLHERLGLLYRLHRELWQAGEKRSVVYMMAETATDDPLALYYTADQLLKRRGEEGGREVAITQRVAPLIRKLIIVEGD